MSASKSPFDIVIVGGAMAGATLALGLAKLNQSLPAKQQLSIALVEAFEPDDSHPGFDARSIAIANGSIFELNQLGIWPALAHLGCAINDIHVSDKGHFGMTELNAEPLGVDALGQVVELSKVGHTLFELLKKADIQLFCPDKVNQLASDLTHHTLTLASGKQIETKLIVAADGANSVIRKQFKQDVHLTEFEQVAIVANVQSDKPHQHWAYERFTDTGPLALLPMNNEQGQNEGVRLSLVWALNPEQAKQMLALPESAFLSALQTAFGNRAGRFTHVGSRVSYPLTLSVMPRPIYHRCVFVGNAAQTLHPIAGQGFNLGLRDVVGLINTIKNALNEKAQAFDISMAQAVDIGQANLLHEYLAGREQDRTQTITNIEFLVRGFSNQYWPLVAGRSIGLRLLSWLPPLKHPVAHIAMGWR